MSLSHTRPLAHRRLLAAGAAAALTLVSGVVGLPQAQAHDSVIDGNPAADEVVEEFPEAIELEFSGIPQDSFNTIAVSDADSGEVLFNGEPTLDGRIVTLPVPDDIDPGAGNYTVGFQITSSDGHATRGSTNFEVAGDESAAAENSETTTSAPANSSGDSTGTTDEAQGDSTAPEDQLLAGPLGWIFGGAGVILVLGVLIVLIAKNRNQT